MEDAITGIVLAGGKSSRMGTDKGLLVHNNRMLIDYPIALLSIYCSEIIISSNSSNYDYLKKRVISDEFAPIGPIGGLFSCLKASNTEWNLFLACDMPFVNSQIIDLLVKNRRNYDAIVPSINGWPLPVCGVYRKNILPLLKSQIENDKHSLQSLLKQANTLIFEIEDSEQRNKLININTKEDYSQIVNAAI